MILDFICTLLALALGAPVVAALVLVTLTVLTSAGAAGGESMGWLLRKLKG